MTVSNVVGGSSATFVERVLEEYGDPAGQSDGSTRDRDDGSTEERNSDDRSAGADSDGPNDDGPNDGHRGGPNDDNRHNPREGSDRDSTPEPSASGSDPDSPGGTGTVGDGGRIAKTESEETSRPPEIRLSGAASNGDGTRDAERSRDGADDHLRDDGERAVVDVAMLSKKQRETLRAVAGEPTATQAEIADRLGVSRAAVAKRLNDIPGFDWASKEPFVERVDGIDPGTPRERGDDDGDSGIATDRIATLEDRIESLERQLDHRLPQSRPSVDDPELVHKVVHACVDADYVSQAEESRILKVVLPSTDPAT